ncbi:MAG: crossover junction endodeoxyribonuclease RuvC [Desulfobulbaceae bacterium]|nr:MAG: crossover junction endodeoxyribonuclease RuvC [Desulfobulbaceae bacterium]
MVGQAGQLILGIDPGSRITGYGLVRRQGARLSYVTCGVIRPDVKMAFADRLLVIYEGICQVIEKHEPDQMAIEDLFMASNPRSALKLGHARGVLLLAGKTHGLPISEYTPRTVKQTVVGYGQAEKGQIQHVVRVLLKLSGTPSEDAADALAVAICHAHHSIGI